MKDDTDLKGWLLAGTIPVGDRENSLEIAEKYDYSLLQMARHLTQVPEKHLLEMEVKAGEFPFFAVPRGYYDVVAGFFRLGLKPLDELKPADEIENWFACSSLVTQDEKVDDSEGLLQRGDTFYHVFRICSRAKVDEKQKWLVVFHRDGYTGDGSELQPWGDVSEIIGNANDSWDAVCRRKRELELIRKSDDGK